MAGTSTLRKTISDTLFTWAWTPYQVSKFDKGDSPLYLPESTTTDDAAIVHFSTLREGEQYSWLWMFNNQNEALSLRLLPRFLKASDDPVSTLLTSTIPENEPGQPTTTYLQVLPTNWFKTWDLSEIHEVWLGFDWLKFRDDRNLRSSSQQFSVDEWLELVARV